jgi:small subunit ribosomal protein S19
MSRSSWKNPYVHQSVRRKVKRIKEMQAESGSKKFRIKIMSRSSQILSDFVDLSFMVHNGRDYRLITVTEDMVGHKFGEFAYTRQRHSFKKKK